MASLTTEARTSSSFSCLPQSSTDHYTYEVFLSFRGEDTRFGFTDHLHSALCQRGISTFRDDKLNRGEDISQELLKAIEDSRVSVIVFSQTYAASRWCLDELVKILECRKSKGQKVRAVFYKIDPSDVRKQTGTFGDAFATLDQLKYKDSMDKWRAALREAADLSGWPSKDGEYETEFINKIVVELCEGVVNPSCELHVATHPIGLQSQEVISRLLLAKKEIVRMVGIWGPGGIGKTTIAKDVFNSIRHRFDGACFLADVRSSSVDRQALAKLQETLLSDILRDSSLKVSCVDLGVSFIEKRMRDKKVLLVLDDVSDSSQLESLVPDPLHCFGPGSRILITTRDKRWLTAHQVDVVYEVKMLEYFQSLNLFSFHAFKSTRPPNDYLELALRAVRYAQGLPLALIVLGSHLFLRSKEEWEDTMCSWKGGDHQTKILEVLRLSYDALDPNLKGYFLDIACFFKGRNANHVRAILEGCYDLKFSIGIARLQEKALIKIIGPDESIWMHDLIEEMGKDIVYQESPDEPGERSRVWSEEDVRHILTDNTGTNIVIGIQVLWQSHATFISAKSFSSMKKLRYICMSCRWRRYESFSGENDYLSDQLRWLYWPNCPLKCFPSDFHAKKLVHLNISMSRKITQLWQGRKNFSSLTVMILKGCESLTELPDFRGIPNLKELVLTDCKRLVEVPDSLGFHDKLVTLIVDNCFNLIKFPRKVNWKSLESISIKKCQLVECFPSDFHAKKLVNLDISGSPEITQLWQGRKNFSSLTRMILRGCVSLRELPDFRGIPNLKELDLTNCMSLVEFPDCKNFSSLTRMILRGCVSLTELPDLRGIPNLKELDLTDYLSDQLWWLDWHFCPLKCFPSDFNAKKLISLDISDSREITQLWQGRKNFSSLTRMILKGCESLTELPDFRGIPNLNELDLTNCKSLVEFPDCKNFSSLTCMILKGCESLTELPDFRGIPNLNELDLTNCKSLVEFPDSLALHDKLVTLTVDNCSDLVKFPRKINLKSLESFSIKYCQLEEFPEVGEKMGSLRSMKLYGLCIRGLHPSTTRLIALEELLLERCQDLTTLPHNLYELRNLKRLTVSLCPKVAAFPVIPIKMDSLRTLALTLTSISGLDESIGNLIGLERLYLRNCNSFRTLPSSIYGLQNLERLELLSCRNLVRFPTNTNSLNEYGCSLSLPKLRCLMIKGCRLSDCDFLTTLDCCKTLELLVLSASNFVSLPGLTKFVNLRSIDLAGCKRIRELPELPPRVKLNTKWCCESLEGKRCYYSISAICHGIGQDLGDQPWSLVSDQDQ